MVGNFAAVGMTALERDDDCRVVWAPGLTLFEDRGCRLPQLVEQWRQAAPQESKLETGRVIEALARHPEGLSKERLLAFLGGPGVSERSIRFRMALEVALNKRLQRARRRIRAYGMDVCFDRQRSRWLLVEYTEQAPRANLAGRQVEPVSLRPTLPRRPSVALWLSH